MTALGAIWVMLPEPAQKVCTGVAVKVLTDLLGKPFARSAKDPVGIAFAGVYRRWSEGLLESEVDEQVPAKAFEEFFCRKKTVDELDKLRLDQYEGIDFNVLAQMLRESCHWAGCPLPESDLYEQLEGWVEALEALLGSVPEYQERFQPGIQNALANLRDLEGRVRNHSLARIAYLNECRHQHRLIRLRGMAEVGGPTEVEMAKVFVVPRVQAQRDTRMTQRQEDEVRQEAPEPVSSHELLNAGGADRVVVLGKPGSGKTTLLENLCLAMAERYCPGFEWAAGVPDWLPIFYRVRHLETDLADHPGEDLWQCLHHHCRQRLSLNLPTGFFRRQMKTGGLLVLLDGLDEVPSEARRIDLVDLVSAFVRNLSAGSRAIITSRPHEYARSRFDADAYEHFDLCPFNDDEIQEFLQGWCLFHEPNRVAAGEEAKRLWKAIEAQPRIKELADNALLLTMIVRVHWWLRALPDSRLDLYAKCTDTLLKHWLEAAGFGGGPLGLDEKKLFLAQLAFDLQDAVGEGEFGEDVLQISAQDLTKKLRAFLVGSRGQGHAGEAEDLIERLHARDAILVNYGGNQFGFVHRSFQEYFAGYWLADRYSDYSDFRELLLEDKWIDRSGWNETLYLAFGQLSRTTQTKLLVELLKRSRVEFAVECLSTGKQQDVWLSQLVRLLSRCYREGADYDAISAAECADGCGSRSETPEILEALFDRTTRDARALLSAVELTEELANRGNETAGRLLKQFFLEASQFRLDSRDRMVFVEGGEFIYQEDQRIDLPSFWIDKYPVTNRDYECMAPSHRGMRDKYSDADDQPVIWVNWYEAKLFCRWRGEDFRLPTEEEWEKAASWDAATGTKRVYPWEGDFDPARCNTHESGMGKTTPVGSYPNGASPYGCQDMAGNVWEWTESRWSETYQESRVLRGGSWGSYPGRARAGFRYDYLPRYRDYYLGFRLVCASPIAGR